MSTKTIKLNGMFLKSVAGCGNSAESANARKFEERMERNRHSRGEQSAKNVEGYAKARSGRKCMRRLSRLTHWVYVYTFCVSVCDFSRFVIDHTNLIVLWAFSPCFGVLVKLHWAWWWFGGLTYFDSEQPISLHTRTMKRLKSGAVMLHSAANANTRKCSGHMEWNSSTRSSEWAEQLAKMHRCMEWIQCDIATCIHRVFQYVRESRCVVVEGAKCTLFVRRLFCESRARISYPILNIVGVFEGWDSVVHFEFGKLGNNSFILGLQQVYGRS